MIASAEWKQGQLFEGRSQSGHAITIDATAEHTAGPSPMEVVLAALCACTSVDVVSILEKASASPSQASPSLPMRSRQRHRHASSPASI